MLYYLFPLALALNILAIRLAILLFRRLNQR